ncbi:capsid protein [Sewage-associated circular DNA virus-34]|uniref:capsid protein n=1 Tax=Sewage-associated circular DNA virus-34 TaxID=1592101 RepID=UPI000585F2E5|nr:capsid protein [Sewage-associated circular DNA virus-34]AJD07564.1 capsid protein [Sewage-associated circular DNA virus-34]
MSLVKYRISKPKYTKKKSEKKFTSKRSINTMLSRLPETKYYDVYHTTTITQNGALDLLTGMTTLGTGEGQRVGSKVFVKYIQVNGLIMRNASSTIDNLRIIIFMDKQGMNTPAVTDIMEPAYLGSGFSPVGRINEYRIPRYKILYDKLTHVSTQKDGFNFKANLRINMPVYYVSTSTFKNQVYILFLGDNGNVLTLPYCNYTARVSYTDQ